MNEPLLPSQNEPDIVGEAIAFMKSPDEHPIPFDEIMAMVRDVATEGKLFEVMSQVLNDETIKDGRKLMMIHVIGFGYSSKFTIEQYNALTILLGFYSRKIEIPESTSGEKVVHMWDSRIIALKVRSLANTITKDDERRISRNDAERVLASPPFHLRTDILATILGQVYPGNFN